MTVDYVAPQEPPQVQILRMMMGYWVAQILATVARLEVADQLANGPQNSDELARLCGANPDGMRRLLRAAVSLGLCSEPAPDRYAISPLGECLRRDVPGSLRDLAIAELAPGHWLPWGHLYEAVKAGKPTASQALGMDLWSYYQKHPEEGASFARGMGNLSSMVTNQVLEAYDFTRFEQVVDVGGSQGMLLSGVLRAVPQARGILFDRPEVIQAGAKTVEAYGLGPRLTTSSGDFFREVPAGGDLYLLKSILHDWDDEPARAILKSVHRAARPGATLLIVEMLAQPDQNHTPVHLMDMNMLVLVGGRERSQAEFQNLLTSSGFDLTRAVPTSGMFFALEARRG